MTITRHEKKWRHRRHASLFQVWGKDQTQHLQRLRVDRRRAKTCLDGAVSSRHDRDQAEYRYTTSHLFTHRHYTLLSNNKEVGT